LSEINNNNCVVTYLYPESKKSIKKFINCLEKQNFKKFDVLFFCDNFNLSNLNFKINLKYKSYNLSGTIPQIRQKSIKKLRFLNYKKIFFCDSDDLFKPNRIKILNKLLEKNKIVFNDIDCINKQKIVKKNFFSYFFNNNQKINYKNLYHQNFLGFSNTAFKSEILKKIKLPNLSKKIIIYDWYFWSKMLKKNKACFTNKTKTYYKTISSSYTCLPIKLTKKYLINSIFVKYNFYRSMRDEGKDYKKMYLNCYILYNNKMKLLKLIKTLILKEKNKYFSWWGGIEL
tara:strand:+ start:107 stop:964 length:858 start_codon:yes stop_codon:yes gene_type:complete